ncbi:MAG TPA: TonB-dependent receptor [Thermoanaerobaculia bacterium]|nr:TonB-dependent receptor [Thermoanaerobaculia bacterium]
MHRKLTLLALVLLLALTSLTAFAQSSTTAVIHGTVNDESGNPFPSAEITATNVNTGFTNRTVAATDGAFQLAGLAPGVYRIDVSATSYKASSKEVRVLVGQNLELDFRLTPDLVLMESITVLGATAVETETSEVATNITRQQIEQLPQNDRNFLNFAQLAPGVLLGLDEQNKQVKAGAQSANAVNVFIDGVSFKNDVIQGGVIGQDSSRGNPFPQNAVQEFRVITQNYSAEYQKASSAIITAVTKSGTNEFTGDAFLFFQDKSLVDENPLNGQNPEYERNQYGFSTGGPIIRDRMHFFVSYEANDQDREDTVSVGSGWNNVNPAFVEQLRAQYAGTFTQPFREDLAFGKVSYQPTSSQIVDGSLNYRKETDIRGFGGETSYEAAENVKNSSWGLNLRHQYTASSWLNEGSASFQSYEWNPSPLNPGQIGLVYEGLLRIGGRDTEQQIGQDRLALRDDLTLSTFKWFGDHTLKVGGNAEFLEYTVTKFFEENPRYFFRADVGTAFPYKARWGFGDPDMSADNQQYGIYGQDDWRFNDKLTFNVGIRWDYETNMIDTDYVTPAEVRARLADDFPADYFTDGNDREPKTDMFQPRLGFSYDVFADGKTVVFGGVGRYYDRNLFNNTLDERFRLQHFVGDFFFSADGKPIPGVGQPAAVWDPKYLTEAGLRELQASGLTGKPEIFLIENDTKVPYSNQWNLGVRRSFGSLVGSLTYSNVRSYNGFSYLWGKGACCPVIDPAYSNVLISSDDVRTWYDAVFVQLDRPYSGNYGFNVAYTWGDAEQVGGDLFSLDKPTIADWPRYGTPGTQEHRIVANGIVGIPWGVRLSGLLQYSSGDRFRINDWSNGFCFNCYNPRTGEGPSWTTIDLRAEKGFTLGPTELSVIAEAFNIFNEERYQYFEDFNGPGGNPNLGKPTAIVGGSQRRYQFGVRVAF